MVGDHTHNLSYFDLLCIACTQVSFSDYVSIKNQSIGVLGACGCLQRRGLGVALAGVRVWSADVDDGVVPEDAAPAVHDVAFI